MGLESDQNKILFEIYKLLTPENEMPLVFKKQDIYNFVNYAHCPSLIQKIMVVNGSSNEPLFENCNFLPKTKTVNKSSTC